MRTKSKISPPIIEHLGPRDLQIMPIKLGWREYMIALQCGINISLLLGSTTRMPVESTHTPVSSEVCT
jgi:hypothetical protein